MRNENRNANTIRQFLNLSELLVELTQNYALKDVDEKRLRFFGIALDNACQLRLEAKKLYSDDKDINSS